MKKILIVAAIVSTIVACSSSGADDKKAQLEKLIAQKKELESQIKKLEKEISDSTGAKQGEKARLVSVTPAAPSPFAHYIELQGKVDAEDNVVVTPQTPGAIERIYVTIGQNVKKGQVLAETDNDAFKNNVETMRTQLSFAQDIFNKQKSLWEQHIGTEVQYLTAKNNVATVEKQLASAEAQLEMSKAIAPINGVVDAIDIQIGEVSSPGFAGIRVVNFSDLRAKGEVSETYSAVVHEGDKVKILFPDIKKEIDSKVTYVSKVINPQSRTFTVESKLSGKETLKPNMIAVMKIVDYETKEAFVVDINLIQRSGEGEFVYVAAEENGRQIAKRQSVVVGKVYGGQAEIVEGLKAGDKVITVGYQDVVAGEAIQF